MVIAALLCFGILFIAWVLAPDAARSTRVDTIEHSAELKPLLEAA